MARMVMCVCVRNTDRKIDKQLVDVVSIGRKSILTVNQSLLGDTSYGVRADVCWYTTMTNIFNQLSG